MNNRIKELAKQAGYRDIFDNDTKAKARLEKYTELIVQECMGVAKYHTPDTEECEYTWLIHDKIAKHFGVKE